MSSTTEEEVVIGVLSLQGAFEEHQTCIEKSVNCKTKQVRTPSDLEGIHGIILPGGESTAMGLIGSKGGIWPALKEFVQSGKPTWGTCAGMILLAERCVGASAVIENGQSLIGGMDILVCRNYFGSQISSFEMATPAPPGFFKSNGVIDHSYPGVFIRAPAILNAGNDLDVLGRVVATPCRQAAVVLKELEEKISRGENVVMMGVVDALQRNKGKKIDYINVKSDNVIMNTAHDDMGEEKKESIEIDKIELPGAADGTNAREVICAARKQNILITAFHPELTNDYRWHQYFYQMVLETISSS